MLAIAFKEWAVICRALAEGRQAVILRKGGIAETGGEFRPEHTRFWLYPTFFHEQADGIVPSAVDLLQDVEKHRPPSGQVPLTHWAEVSGVYHVQSEAAVLSLTGLHLWSADKVRQRFAYRRPGVYVLVVRVYRADHPATIIETPEFAGCKSWVDLGHGWPDAGKPVLDDAAFERVRDDLSNRLQPKGLI